MNKVSHRTFYRIIILSLLLFVGLFFGSRSTFAYTNVFGPISSDTIWQTGEIYVIDGEIVINSGVTVTAEPGAIVKFKPGGSLIVYGNLIANGALTEKVYFTSIKDDSIGGDTNGDGALTIPGLGDWNQIKIYSGGVADLDYAFVAYGGSGFPIFSNIYINGGELVLTNSVVAFSLNFGIEADDGLVTITNSSISNNFYYGLASHGTGSLSVTNSSFNDNGFSAGFIDFGEGKTLNSSGNSASGLGKKGFYIQGPISVNHTLNPGVPYIISNIGLTVNSGSTLTINPGTIIKFDTPFATAKLVIDGQLNAQGTANNKISFTSIKDDSIGGDTNGDSGSTFPNPSDWSHIQFNSGSSGTIKHAVISYGGGWSSIFANLYLNGGDLDLSFSKISNSSLFGVNIGNGSINITSSEVINNTHGIYKEGGSVSVFNSSIFGNSGYGIYNSTFSSIDAENNWWGDPTGPYNPLTNFNGQGNQVSSFIDFDPWLQSPPDFSEVLAKEPIIIVPGILGSRLNRASDGEEIWPNINLMAIPGPDSYLDELKLDDNGNEVIDIDSSEIIESVLGLNQYGNLIQKFEDHGYQLNQDLFIVPYDWRLDIEISSTELDAIVNGAISNSPTGKVSFIAHSMGGLLVKDYLIRNGELLVNKVVFAGTPHLGAPKAFNLLNWGDDFDLKFLGLGLNENRAKEIGQNMPSVYQLLPSREYLDLAGPYVKTNNLLNYDQTSQFLISSPILSDHRNSGLVNLSDQFHQTHDPWLPQTADVYNLLGCREYDTIGSFEVENNGSVDIDSINGDGTVPLISAEYVSGNNYFVSYPVTKINHVGLISKDTTINLIHDLITSNIEPNLPNGIFKTSARCDEVLDQIKRLRFSTHSPVNLHAYDNLGNHTGLMTDGNIELGIPDSEFIQVGESSFIFVPEGEYSVLIDAYNTGSFDFKIKELVNGEVQNAIIFNDIPINNANLKADLEFVDINDGSLLEVDRDGDGIVDAEYSTDGSWTPQNATVQSTIDDLERIYLLGWTSGEVKNSLKALLEASLPTTESQQSKGKKADGVLGTAFLKQLEMEYNKGRINEKAYNIIKIDIILLLPY